MEGLFEALSILALASAFGLLVARHAVVGVLCLLACLSAVGGLAVLLAAELIAIALLLFASSAALVALLVLFMLLGVGEFWPERLWRRLVKLVAIATATLLGVTLLGTLPPAAPPSSAQVIDVGGAAQVGRVLLGAGLLPMLASSLALLSASIGVLVLARVRAE